MIHKDVRQKNVKKYVSDVVNGVICCRNATWKPHFLHKCLQMAMLLYQGFALIVEALHIHLKIAKKMKKEDGSLPFALCFICNTPGHISSQCPASSTGKYPKGGSCRVCGSIFHLQLECPEYKNQNEKLQQKRDRNKNIKHNNNNKSNGNKYNNNNYNRKATEREEDPDAYWMQQLL